MSQGMRMDFFLESPFMPNRMKIDRETLGGLADMFGQMPGVDFVSNLHRNHIFFLFYFYLESLCKSVHFAQRLSFWDMPCSPCCIMFLLWFSQAVGLGLAQGLFRTGTLLQWDAIAPTRSLTATGATSLLHRSHSLTWGQSLLLSPTR